MIVFSNKLFTQQIRFYVEGKAGNSTFYQNDIINFSENIDIVSILNENSTELSVQALYNTKHKWRAGLKLGYAANRFALRFNGPIDVIANYFGNINEASPNYAEMSYWKVGYYVFNFRNELKLYSSKRLNFNPFIDLGINLVNKSQHTLQKIEKNSSRFAAEEYAFYQKFKNHAFIEFGGTFELIRQRLGLSASYKRSLTNVYKPSEIKYLSSFSIGLRYNFSNFNISKFNYTKQEKTELNVKNNSKPLVLGVRFSYPINAKITTTGQSFHESPVESGEILISSGDYTLERDFPILPSVYAKQKLFKCFELEPALSLRSYYMNIPVEKITPTSSSKETFGKSVYLLYACADLNGLITILEKKEHKVQAILGISSWRDFQSTNLSKIQNANVGLQYGFNKINVRLNYHRSFNKIPYVSYGDMKLKHFTYLDFSVAYDLLQKQKKHRS